MDIEGLAGLARGNLAGSLSGYSKTPMEKAIRIAINESVKTVVAKTPKEYYRVPAYSEPQAAPVTPPATPQKQETSFTTPSQPAGPESRVDYVKWLKVSLREGPGTNFKTLVEVKKGTALEILEEKGQWLRVRLEDGQEGWIGKATTSETP